ncbi:unnamed protein product [Blepharisma stoltei]|uniref:Uncharacterized protein n=1 Tax=Blepharisma stoltei TaxID=1481888 RepID=A0AAU9J516_9CILI|nr:unnamed protein product [Blepharisma stoltei]
MASSSFLERFKNKTQTLGRTGEIGTGESKAVSKLPEFIDRLQSTSSFSPYRQQNNSIHAKLKLPKLESKETLENSKTPRPIIKPSPEATSRILTDIYQENSKSPLKRRIKNKSMERLPEANSKGIVSLKSKMDKMKFSINQNRNDNTHFTDRSYQSKEKVLPPIYRYQSETRRVDHSFLKPPIYSSFGRQ